MVKSARSFVKNKVLSHCRRHITPANNNKSYEATEDFLITATDPGIKIRLLMVLYENARTLTAHDRRLHAHKCIYMGSLQKSDIT